MAVLLIALLLVACAPAITSGPTSAPANRTTVPTSASATPEQPNPVPTSAPDAKSTTEPSTGPWEFTDDRGVKVSLPQRPVRIVAQSKAAAALWDLGIQVVGVFGPQRRADGSKDPQIGDVDLDTVESVGQEWGELDLEKLAALRPDLIVTTMYLPPDLWYITPEVEPKVAAIAPIVAISQAQRPVSEPIARFAELAESLGADLNTPEITAGRQRFEEASADLRAAIAEKPGLKVLVVSGQLDNLWVANPPYHADLQYFEELGLDIVVPEAPDPDGYWEQLSWEQMLRYPADLILQDARNGDVSPEHLAEHIPTWNLHPAVQAGQVGPWRAEGALSHKGFAPILEELAETIREARADVVD